MHRRSKLHVAYFTMRESLQNVWIVFFEENTFLQGRTYNIGFSSGQLAILEKIQRVVGVLPYHIEGRFSISFDC